MSVSYKKLWKLLIDKDMKKKDLCEKAGISPASFVRHLKMLKRDFGQISMRAASECSTTCRS